MGGFALISTSAKKPFWGLERMTLTADGIQFLYENFPEVIPNLSVEDINDRSKTDSLAKLITC
jgi:hypothetical protein